ncbi:hypothetical protein D5086_003895 [Populus alba]|uniref:Uncharacterized protein n=1 Tax=Populus alba TaxID=43335 RepID=A0ACC4D5Z5_POPAL
MHTTTVPATMWDIKVEKQNKDCSLCPVKRLYKGVRGTRCQSPRTMQGERSQFARESGECVASSFRGTQREPKGMRDQSPKEGIRPQDFGYCLSKLLQPSAATRRSGKHHTRAAASALTSCFDACRDRESNFDVASSRNLAQELVFHTQRASGSFQAFANSLLIINCFNSFGQILQPSAAIRTWLRSLPVAKPRQAAAFELTVLHGTAASFMLARQKRKESRKSMEKKRFFMAMSSTPV